MGNFPLYSRKIFSGTLLYVFLFCFFACRSSVLTLEQQADYHAGRVQAVKHVTIDSVLYFGKESEARYHKTLIPVFARYGIIYLPYTIEHSGKPEEDIYYFDKGFEDGMDSIITARYGKNFSDSITRKVRQENK